MSIIPKPKNIFCREGFGPWTFSDVNLREHFLGGGEKKPLLRGMLAGQIITTSAEVTLNGGLIRELPQNPLNSGLGIILICPECWENIPKKKTTTHTRPSWFHTRPLADMFMIRLCETQANQEIWEPRLAKAAKAEAEEQIPKGGKWRTFSSRNPNEKAEPPPIDA